MRKGFSILNIVGYSPQKSSPCMPHIHETYSGLPPDSARLANPCPTSRCSLYIPMRRDAHLFIRSLNRAEGRTADRPTRGDQLFASLHFSFCLPPSLAPFPSPDHVLFVRAAEIRIRAESKRATDNLSWTVFLPGPARLKGLNAGSLSPAPPVCSGF